MPRNKKFRSLDAVTPSPSIQGTSPPKIGIKKADSKLDFMAKGEYVFSFVVSEFVDWIDEFLVINELVYPAISQAGSNRTLDSPSSPDPKTPRSYDEGFIFSKGIHKQGASVSAFEDLDDTPIRKFIPLSSVKGFQPVVIERRQNIVMHVITPSSLGGVGSMSLDLSPTAGVATGNLFGLSNLSINGKSGSASSPESMIVSPFGATPASDDPGDGIVSYEETHEGGEKRQMGKDNVDVVAIDTYSDIPPLYLQSCMGTSLYLLGSYSYATISNCIDCDIVVGAVSGSVRLIGCERVKLTISCKKLVVISCLECQINIACLQPSLLVGENKGLIVGKNYLCLKLFIFLFMFLC